MLERIWNNSELLSGESLTPVGEMIGVLTSDHLAEAASTNFTNWDSD